MEKRWGIEDATFTQQSNIFREISRHHKITAGISIFRDDGSEA